MPYRVERSDACPPSKPWAVMGPERKVGCHESKDSANRQVAALYANEPGLSEVERIALLDFADPLSPEELVQAEVLVEHLAGKHSQTTHGKGISGRAPGVTGLSPETMRGMASLRAHEREHSVGVHTPGAAADALAAGKHANIAPSDVGATMDVLAKGEHGHPDLTELKVAGTHQFGDEGLGLARSEMPQVPESAVYAADLRARGVKVTNESIDPRALQPMQKEISATASARIYQDMKKGEYRSEARVTISSDNFVLDGHHRWGASTAYAFEADFKLPVQRVSLDHSALLADARDFNTRTGIEPLAIGESILERLSRWGESLVEHLKGQHDQNKHAHGAVALDPTLVDGLSSFRPTERANIVARADSIERPGSLGEVPWMHGEHYNMTPRAAADELHGMGKHAEFERKRGNVGEVNDILDRAAHVVAYTYPKDMIHLLATNPSVRQRTFGEALLVEHPGHPSQKAHGRGAATTATTRAVRERGGGTLEPGRAKRVTTGSVVARPGHSASFDGDRWDGDPAYRKEAVGSYLRDNKAEFAKGGKFGIWDSRGEGGSTIVFDIVDVVPRAEAIKLGRERGEDGVFDLDKGEYVPTGGRTYT